MLKEIVEGLVAASLILGMTIISFVSDKADEESTEIIHVWTFVDKTFDDEEQILVEGSYDKRI